MIPHKLVNLQSKAPHAFQLCEGMSSFENYYSHKFEFWNRLEKIVLLSLNFNYDIYHVYTPCQHRLVSMEYMKPQYLEI